MIMRGKRVSIKEKIRSCLRLGKSNSELVAKVEVMEKELSGLEDHPKCEVCPHVPERDRLSDSKQVYCYHNRLWMRRDDYCSRHPWVEEMKVSGPVYVKVSQE
jgi:hypothetical protein